MSSTLVRIGPPVLNGGVSTLVAVLALSSSESHVFASFHKVLRLLWINRKKKCHSLIFLLQVFFLMVIFGLFHGLIFLPALLATMGPRAYTHAGEEEEEQQVRDSPKKKTFYPFQMCLFFDRKHRKQLAEAAPETRKRRRRSCSTWRTEEKIEGEQIE